MKNELKKQNLIIKSFLAEVRSKLPYRMKSQRSDVEDILEELEEHIWDEAGELAQGQDPSKEQVEFVISRMGSPREIAKEYRHRGKPKFFITEELYPMYWKSLAIVSSTLIVIIIGLTFLFAEIHSLVENVKNFFIWTILGLLLTINITTLVFVSLSMQGYLPEDFKKISKSENREFKLGFNYFKKQDYLIIGIVGIIISLFMILTKLIYLPPGYVMYLISLTNWLAGVGTVLLIANGIRFIQALVGYRKQLQVILMIAHCVPIAVLVPFFIAFMDQGEIAINLISLFLPDVDVRLFATIFSICIFCIVLVIMITDIVRAFIIGIKGFPFEGGRYT